MANAKKGSSGNQRRVEKKDMPPRASRSDHRGSQVHENIESPQLDQARGKRTAHAQPGSKGSQGFGEPSMPADRPHNTRSGGSRPKGREKHGRQGGLDHD